MNTNDFKTGSQSPQEFQNENLMNKAKRLIGMIGLVFCGALPVAAKQRTPAPTRQKNLQTQVRREVVAGETKAVAAHAPPQVEQKAAATAHRSAVLAPKYRAAQSETRKPLAAVAESKPAGNHPPAVKEPTRQIAKKQPLQPAKSFQPSSLKAKQVSEPPAREKPAASEKNESNASDKNHEKKGKD